MQNLTHSLVSIEPIAFARGGFAVLHRATYCEESSSKVHDVRIGLFLVRVASHPYLLSQVAIKFPDVLHAIAVAKTRGGVARLKAQQVWQNFGVQVYNLP